MRVTKRHHACLEIAKDGAVLVIDPGSFTPPLDDLRDVVGVVVTHEHPDHWTPEHLAAITERFPGIPILGPAGVVAAASGVAVTEVSLGDRVQVGPFTLSFHGGEHAVIHESLPVIDNVGVLVDDAFYYPGDSYAVPTGADVQLLAAPIGAPWLKIGEAMDFVLAVAPRRAFGTHDMTLSDIGRKLGRERLTWAVEQDGGAYLDLQPGDAADL